MSNSNSRPQRSAGILLHPTSLPGGCGIGDLGPSVFAWIDTLARAGQRWWQILPLGHPGKGDSPYQCFSAFAGNPNLISPEMLAADGWLHRADFEHSMAGGSQVDYGAVTNLKNSLLDRAWENFTAHAAPSAREELERFCRDQASWLNDYALYMALKEAHGGVGWHDWPAPIRLRQTDAIAQARQELGPKAARHQFRQFVFFRQWARVRGHAHSRGIRIIGDVPIFVAGDSAEVWANPHLFLLDSERRQTAQAGVPPDYFAATGQLWGNPLYDWDASRRDGYAWWIARMKATFATVDLVRIDHFRGFAAAWHVPGSAKTAERGAWVPGPGADLFLNLRHALGHLNVIAEDLGVITPDVIALRDSLGLPGMRVLQFAFGGGPDNPFLPHNFVPHCVAYTGTHDNDTTRGWYAGRPHHEQDHVRRYLGRDGSNIAWDMMRTAWGSVADVAIAPMQDVLDLGSEARMNTPGIADGNWRWRMLPGAFNDHLVHRVAEMTNLYGR